MNVEERNVPDLRVFSFTSTYLKGAIDNSASIIL